jgi:glucose/arabinose dehydrogenase
MCRRSRYGRVGVMVAALLTAAAWAATAQAVSISLMPFATGITVPTAIANAGDSRLFLVEQTGHIRVIQSDGTILGPDFLDVSSLITEGGEQGLLGLAFHPHYASNGFFYVYYNNLSGDIQISRFTVSGSPATSNVADPLSEQMLLTIPHPTYTNHNGGNLLFGPDGYLYAGTGDGGSGCDPNGNGQNTDVLLAKILRLDVDSGSPYAIPPTNPFFGSLTQKQEIWAYGVRNPWRYSFDSANGNLYIADVGQDAIEEVDFQLAGSAGGQNYGWNCYEGDSLAHDSSGCTPSVTCTPMSMFTFPVYEYDHYSGGRCAITGGFVYRGVLSPSIVGHYFFADLCSADFYSLTTPDNGMTWNTNSFGVPVSGLTPTCFGQDINGEVYVAGQGSDTVYRITAGAPPAGCPAEPASGCAGTSTSGLKIKRPGDTSKNSFIWKWLNGPGLMPSDFGDPAGGSTSYNICLYAGTSAAGISLGIDGGANWTSTSSGFKYTNSSTNGSGVFKTLLKAGSAGKSKVLVKAKGANLDLSALPLNLTADLTVQLIRNDAPECLEAIFPMPSAVTSDDGTQFKAKIP